MNKILFRLCAILCLVGVGAFGFQRIACDRPGTEEPGPHVVPTAVGEYLEGVDLATDLQALAESNHWRLQAKHAVVTELLAGRLTLREAAARFEALNADDPEIRNRLSQLYPGVSYKEALCRNVIEHARSELRLRAPEQMDSVVARLEAELHAHLECAACHCLP